MKTIRARWFTEGRTAPIRVIVCHDMEAPEGPLTAENVANYFATTSRKASAHVNVDNNSAVRSVDDGDTAWAAPGCNHDGLQLEIAGYARQTRAQWLDEYSTAALKQAAKVAAAWAKQYDIPVRHLTVAELKAGKKGFVGHVDVSNAYGRTDHGDPGQHFPWPEFLAWVRKEMADTAPKPTAPPWPGRVLANRKPMMHGADVLTWQKRMKARGWTVTTDGFFGPDCAELARAFQREKRLTVTGKVDEKTWKASFERPVT